MPAPGVGSKTDREVRQEETAVPRVYTSTATLTPPIAPFYFPSLPGIFIHRPDKFTGWCMLSGSCDGVRLRRRVTGWTQYT